jgi:hypothetical protein
MQIGVAVHLEHNRVERNAHPVAHQARYESFEVTSAWQVEEQGWHQVGQEEREDD